ncbi:hypothetical protein FACS1894177_05690 [Bacteroidia bacterium]|nr:hypothetical protein FACS1894177_05690 [Bacteroidia bacterium]
MKYDPNGVSVTLSEENIREKFPLSYNEVTSNCRERYSNFIQNANFHAKMKEIKVNTKLHHSRELDPTNKKSPKKSFFSTNIWKELDKCYSVKEKYSTTQKKENSTPNLFDNK